MTARQDDPKSSVVHRWQIEHIRQGLREATAGNFASKVEVKRVLNRLRGRGESAP